MPDRIGPDSGDQGGPGLGLMRAERAVVARQGELGQGQVRFLSDGALQPGAPAFHVAQRQQRLAPFGGDFGQPRVGLSQGAQAGFGLGGLLRVAQGTDLFDLVGQFRLG